MKRKLLFILSTAPYGTSLAAEALDAVLIAGVFEQDVTLYYTGDGVYQLLKNQSPLQLSTRNQGKASRALPEYDINRIYVDAETLENTGLTLSDLVLPVQIISDQQLTNLIAQQHALLNF